MGSHAPYAYRVAVRDVMCCPRRERIFAHGQVEVLPGLLVGKEAREDHGISPGGHAAVASHEAGNAARKQTLPPVSKAHGSYCTTEPVVRSRTKKGPEISGPFQLTADCYLTNCSLPVEPGRSRCGSSSASLNWLNCCSSVEPVRAVVEETPPEMTWVTSSK